MKTTLEGVIETIFPTEIKGSFEKRIFWIKEKKEKYANVWQLECQGNDSSILDKFKPSQEVICNVTIRGFKWNKQGKDSVFNTLQCTLIKHLH